MRTWNRGLGSTMVLNHHESSRKYWATRSSVCSFARATHSFACSALLTSLARSAALIFFTLSLAHSQAHGKVVFLRNERADFIQFRPIVGWGSYFDSG